MNSILRPIYVDTMSSFWVSLESLLRQHEVDESIITRFIPAAEQNDEIMDRLLTMSPSEAYRFVLQPKIQMETSKRLSCELSKGIFDVLNKYRQELSDKLSENTEVVWDLYEDLVSKGYVSTSEDQFIRPEKYNTKRHKKRPSSSATKQSRKRTKKQNKTQTNDDLVTIQDIIGELADRPLRVFPSLPKPNEAYTMSKREITGICVLWEACKPKSSREKDLLGYKYTVTLSTDETVVYLNDNNELWIGVGSSPFQTFDTEVTHRMIQENVPVIQRAIRQLSPQKVYMIGRNLGAVVILIAGKTVSETSFMMTIGAPLSISVRSASLCPSDSSSLSFPTAMLSRPEESNPAATAAEATTTTTTTTTGSGSESSTSKHQLSRNAEAQTKTSHPERESTLTLSAPGVNPSSDSESRKNLVSGSGSLSHNRADGSYIVASTGNDDDADTDSDTDMSGIEEVRMRRPHPPSRGKQRPGTGESKGSERDSTVEKASKTVSQQREGLRAELRAEVKRIEEALAQQRPYEREKHQKA
jgi:hypothetical protein